MHAYRASGLLRRRNVWRAGILNVVILGNKVLHGIICGFRQDGQTLGLLRKFCVLYVKSISWLESKYCVLKMIDLRNANIASAHYTSSYDFWSDVKRANACNAKSNARVVINGLSSPPDIANAFKDMYEKIFRAGLTSSDDIQRFRIELNQRCKSETFQRFTPDDVIKRVCNLSQTRKTLICSCFRIQLLMHRMISLSFYVLLLMPLSSMVTYQLKGYQAP